MALTLTKDFTWGAGGRKMMFLTVTHDETTSTFTAASIGFDQIEGIIPGAPVLASAAADTSIYARYTQVSITGDNNSITFTEPMKVASLTRLLIVGW